MGSIAFGLRGVLFMVFLPSFDGLATQARRLGLLLLILLFSIEGLLVVLELIEFTIILFCRSHLVSIEKALGPVGGLCAI